MDKTIDLIQYLYMQADWVTALQISQALNISQRTVKNYIAKLNAAENVLIQSSKKGYLLNKEKAQKYLDQEHDKDIPQSYAERKRYILFSILMQDRKPHLYDLAEELYISPATLQKELNKIRKEISSYNLLIRTKQEIITIFGSEEDQKRLVLDLINEEVRESNLYNDSYSKIFTHVNLKTIERIVVNIINEYEFFLDSYSLFNYVLHLGLTIELRSHSASNDNALLPEPRYDSEISDLIISPKIKEIVTKIYAQLRKIYDLNYNLDDIIQASLLMSTRVISTNLDEVPLEQLGSILGQEVVDLLYSIVDSIHETYGFDLNNKNFLVRFAFHLKNLLIRLENKISLENLQFTDIKNNYILIYAISVHISNIISQNTGYSIPEDEISYIALHVGVMMDEIQMLNQSIKAIIICPNYYLVGRRIYRKLNGFANDQLLISDVLTAYPNQEMLDSTDLIITTEHLQNTLHTNAFVYTIDPFVSDQDLNNLLKIIEEIKSHKTRNSFLKKIKYFFHEDTFFVNQNFENSTQAIETICDSLLRSNYVDATFKDAIYKHEKISTSNYGKVAIAHPLDNNAKTSVIAVSLHPKPIPWGQTKVNIVFMLSLRKEDRSLFSDIFDCITKCLLDEQIFYKIVNSKSFDVFLAQIAQAFEKNEKGEE
jgi:lichenan operon transcriptional antiterminator